jgi:hypothetical protein
MQHETRILRDAIISLRHAALPSWAVAPENPRKNDTPCSVPSLDFYPSPHGHPCQPCDFRSLNLLCAPCDPLKYMLSGHHLSGKGLCL